MVRIAVTGITFSSTKPNVKKKKALEARVKELESQNGQLLAKIATPENLEAYFENRLLQIEESAEDIGYCVAENADGKAFLSRIIEYDNGKRVYTKADLMDIAEGKNVD